MLIYVHQLVTISIHLMQFKLPDVAENETNESEGVNHNSKVACRKKKKKRKYQLIDAKNFCFFTVRDPFGHVIPC